MADRLYIKDLQNELPYRDRRTLLKWCMNNGVGVFSDVGSNRLYVLKEEFEFAKMNQPVSYFKNKYGTDVKKLKTGNESRNYKPGGEYEMKFLSYLQNY